MQDDIPQIDRGRVKIVAIGISTGGPKVLREVLSGLPADLSVPIVIAQHIPPAFSKSLATSLDLISPLTVVEAEDGMPIYPGTVYLGKGHKHIRVRRGSRLGHMWIEVNEKPDGLFYLPSADELLASCAAIYGDRALGIVMTGIGRDGTEGARAIRNRGGLVISQDKASSAVYGMPKSVMEAGISAAALKPAQITQMLLQLSTSYPPPCLKKCV